MRWGFCAMSITRGMLCLILLGLVAPAGAQEAPGPGVVWYVNRVAGSDDADGRTPETAWASLERVNAQTFHPGDEVRFAAGTVYQGQLRLRGSGRKYRPIVVGSYGQGAPPRIDGRGEARETVLLENVEYVHLRDLEITNTGREREARRTGVRVVARDCGTLHDIRLTGLYIHDVNGSNVKADGGGYGIQWHNGGRETPSRFDGLLIENCRLVRTDRNGICGSSSYTDRRRWHPSLNVVIRNNVLEDIGGDAIVPIGCDGALVEANVVRGARRRCEDYAAGIWPWACDNTVIQCNDVSGVKGLLDGQGYDSDWNCRNTIIQYNYSHDNEGGFLLICNKGGATMPYSVGNVGTIVRYNLSVNDGARLFHISGPCRQTKIYNNCFYVGPGRSVYGVLATRWEDWPADTAFTNNIWYAAGEIAWNFNGREPEKLTTDLRNVPLTEVGPDVEFVFSHNAFFGQHSDARPPDEHAITADPKLRAPGPVPSNREDETIAGYQLADDSPCIDAAMPVANPGRRDFYGNALPTEGPCDVGAYEWPATQQSP